MPKKIFNKKSLLNFRRKLREQSTRAEDILWYRLRNSELGYKFRRQHSIGDYIVDFYCVPLKLVIELDGLTHEDEAVCERDFQKEAYLKAQGCIVLRFDDSEVRNNLEQILEVIYQECHKPQNPSP